MKGEEKDYFCYTGIFLGGRQKLRKISLYNWIPVVVNAYIRESFVCACYTDIIEALSPQKYSIARPKRKTFLSFLSVSASLFCFAAHVEIDRAKSVPQFGTLPK